MRIALINGPNLNLLGQREPDIYGRDTLADLEGMARRHAQTLGIELECYQSNSEGHLIDALHRARLRCQGVVLNPGGYTHTSVALRDAISAIGIPVLEVHLSNPHRREEFRHVMITTGACVGQICGLGLVGYEMALSALHKLLRAGVGAARSVVGGGLAVGAPVVPIGAAGSETKTFEIDSREDRSERDRNRRRRGRRGGRSRHRDGELLEGEVREAGTGEPAEDGNEREDIASRYANLKGATVRRGLDVLAEDEDKPAAHQVSSGSVNFSDAAEEDAATAEISARPESPGMAELKSRKESSAMDSTGAEHPETRRRPEPLYGRPRPNLVVSHPSHEQSEDKSPIAPPSDTVAADIGETSHDKSAEVKTGLTHVSEDEDFTSGKPRKTGQRGRPKKIESRKPSSRPKKTARHK